ncbi:MAG: DNA-directed RNA polymerase subunit delta [Bacilli bacterium]|nr:DNA-directed RNA polymerase subunit delta [Bacilli bacterium]
MSINNLSKEELELYSHKDITYMLIKEFGPMNTADLFKKITDSLELPKSFYENKIGDYYTTLTTDKRFILLDDGNWDLKEKYASDKVKIDIDEEELDEEDEEELEESTDEIEEEEEEDEDNFDSTVNDDDFDDSDDDYKDLVIIDEDEMELEE